MDIEELLTELGITLRGNYSEEDNYVIDISNSNEYGRINSILDRTYDYVNKYELSDIFLSNNTYTDIETDIKNTKISSDKILYHIIQDYYMRPYINSGDIIDYDFMEFESKLEKDSENNTLFSTMDATKEDKLEN